MTGCVFCRQGTGFHIQLAAFERVARDGSDKWLGLGLIDGRNTRRNERRSFQASQQDSSEAQRRRLRNPSCGLEFSGAKAYRKLLNMAKLKMFGERIVRDESKKIKTS
jgi:methionine synthase II (cobalamin-independent)